MALTTSWRDRLQPASFRGVTFSVESDESTFGRRVQVHEYPGRDKPWTEDLGRATRRISVNAYLIGDDYPEHRDRLIAAIETAGPGTLVHPWYGEMTGSIDGQVRVTHSDAEGRMCRIAFQFVESGELSFPIAGIATDQKILSSAGLLDEALSAAMEALSLDGLPDFIQSGILADGADMLGKIADTFMLVDSGVAAAMRLMQGDLSVVLMPPSAADKFVRTLQMAWRAGSRLTGDVADLTTMITLISGVAVDPGLAPHGVWENDAGTVVVQKQQRNLIASALRITAISNAARAVAQLPRPPRLSAVNATATARPTHPALGLWQETSKRRLVTWDDLQGMRTSLNTAVDREQLRVTDDSLFLALGTLRADINGDISERLEQTEKTVSRLPRGVQPALVLAAEWYDDAGRESDILGRNAIKHPGFIPVMPLRVPAR